MTYIVAILVEPRGNGGLRAGSPTSSRDAKRQIRDMVVKMHAITTGLMFPLKTDDKLLRNTVVEDRQADRCSF
jgi:hypothetical protein